MRAFWLHFAEKKLRFALRMRALGKQQRRELQAKFPELKDEPWMQVWRDCFKAARESVKAARRSRANAAVIGEGVGA